MTITTTTTSRTSSTISTPSPLMPGGCINNCDMWYRTEIGDYCAVIIIVLGNFRGTLPGLTRDDLKVFNPGIAPYCPAGGLDLVLPFGTYVCVHTPGWQPQPSETSSSTTPTIITPLPTQSGMVAGCTSFYRVDFGEFCDDIVDNLIGDFPGITVPKLVYWNPAVGSDCGGIERGTYVCIQGPNLPITTTSRSSSATTTTTTSSRTTTASSTSTTAFTYPTPSSGTAPDCIKLAYFRSTDTCDTFVSRYTTSDGLTKVNLILWNTLLLPDCSGLADIRLHNVCIAVSVGTTTTTSSRTTMPTSRSTTTTAVIFTGNPSSFSSASTAVCAPTTTTPTPPKITGGTTLNTAITTACQQLIGSSGSFWMEVGNPYKAIVTVGGVPTQFLIQIRLGGFSVTQSLCVSQFQAINTKCTSGSPGLTPGGCFYTTDANMVTCIFTS
ncbi:hypothetical protein TWF718_003569 [Orbilia javanica]|uniref:LysM domain-containing protein n=1 Tax=Orbilia javanica TaxID=47235 RepID=A0AAN8NYJ7_9PEZI